MFIYKIINNTNGKCYIGQTKNPYKRRNEHFNRLNKNVHPNPKLQHAWNKYGSCAFEFKVIYEAITTEELDMAEIEFIRSIGHYNCKGGGTKGYKISIETKEKMKAAKTQVIRNQYSTRMKLKNPMHNSIYRNKVKESRKRQRRPTKEENIKMSEKLKTIRPSAKLTPIEVAEIRTLYKNGLTYKTLASQYNVGKTTIGRIIKGLSWSFVLENE